METYKFPYKSILKFDTLEPFWQESFEKNEYQELLASKNPEKWIKENPKEAKKLFHILFPIAQHDQDLVAAMPPFQYNRFYSTKGFDHYFPTDNIFEEAHSELYQMSMNKGKIIKACMLILEKVYNYDLRLDKVIMFNLPDKDTGLQRIYKLDLDERFFNIKASKEAKKPTEEELEKLFAGRDNVEEWIAAFPPEHYTFEGFMLLRFTDVTTSEMLSAIKAELLKKDAVLKSDIFERIQTAMRSVFRAPGLQVGLAFFDLQDKLITPNKTGWHSVIVDCQQTTACTREAGSIYEQAYQEKKLIVIEDLTRLKNITEVEKNLITNGYKNLVIAPLVSNGEVLGILELACPERNSVSSLNAHLLDPIIPMFVVAVERVVEDMEAQVREIIQQEFTSIHPTVTWKFYEEGVRLLEKRRNGQQDRISEVQFQNVYPLYGLSDIRGSSEIRSEAIKQDLITNIDLIVRVLDEILKSQNLEILDELKFKLTEQKNLINDDLSSDYESESISLIKNEVNPVLEYFARTDESIDKLYQNYRHKLAGEPILMEQRKSFENSVTHLNQTVAAHLIKQQESLQSIYPHYFEFFKTDGVEYNMYIGQSLTRDREFNSLHLKNARLWQLVTTAQLAILAEELKSNLSTPLSVAHLILVQNDPIDIKFRQDEKRFDVDGTYNVRYEIVKKRIDKATTNNGAERVTQPGKISIIYSHSQEVEEYRRYINYLQHKHIFGEVEELVLDDLPGANGLKAIRVEVLMKKALEQFTSESIQSLLANLEIGKPG